MRIVFLFCIFVLSLFGSLNKVIIDVNGEAITKLDIRETAQKFKLSKDNSISKIIMDIIIKQEFKNRNIEVYKQEIDEYIKKIANNNKVSILELKNKISQDMNLEVFMEDIKKKIKQEKLNIEILREKRFSIDEKSLKNFYDKNIAYYSNYSDFLVKEYVSRNLEALKSMKNNPLMISKLVQIRDTKIEINKINDEDIKQALLQTKKKSFSKIVFKNNAYIMFYILEKKKISTMPFEKVKNTIHSKIYQEKSQKVIESYFQRKKLQSNIDFTSDTIPH